MRSARRRHARAMRHLRTAITFPRHATEVPISAAVWGADCGYRGAVGTAWLS